MRHLIPYSHFEDASNEADQSMKALFSLLQRLCEADELRSCIAKTILMTVPQHTKTKQRQARSTESRLKPTNSTDSGHTLVHSVPVSPQGSYFTLEDEGVDPVDYHIMNPEIDFGQDGSPFSYLEYLMHTMVEYEFPNFLATFMLLLLPEQTYKVRLFCLCQ